jgi:hypothetical protein
MVLLTPFLTQLDSRAAIKGSRDPLGVQMIWTRLGRHVVANLTTVSNSVRDFTVLLLGYYFAARIADEGGAAGDLASFLKWEQFAGYARASVNKERGFRGTERVAQRLQEGERVRLSVDASAQILGNQKIYGLWGLYTVPGKASGLLEGDPTRLTVAARDVVERSLLPAMELAGPKTVQGVVDRLRGNEYALDLRGARDAVVLTGVARVLGKLREPERQLYREHLLHGGPGDRDPTRGTQGRQRLFAELLADTWSSPDWTLTPRTLRAIAARAARRREPAAQPLAHHLERIAAAELVLAPAVALFEHVLGCDGQSLSAIAAGVRRHWGKAPSRTIDVASVEALEPELRLWGDDAGTGRRWVQIATSLHDTQYEETLRLLLEQNAAVMKARSAAAPWADVRQEKLHVRFRDEQATHLPDADALPNYWRHAYFVESLRGVAFSLRDEP